MTEHQIDRLAYMGHSIPVCRRCFAVGDALAAEDCDANVAKLIAYQLTGHMPWCYKYILGVMRHDDGGQSTRLVQVERGVVIGEQIARSTACGEVYFKQVIGGGITFSRDVT